MRSQSRREPLLVAAEWMASVVGARGYEKGKNSDNIWGYVRTAFEPGGGL